MTKEELEDKCDWEGGVLEAICGYGIPPSWLPDDTPEPVIEAWTRLYTQASKDVEVIYQWFDA